MGVFRVGVGMDLKKASNNMNKMLVAQSDRYHFSLSICATYIYNWEVAQSEQVAQIVRTGTITLN